MDPTAHPERSTVGDFHRLGATLRPEGVNFALYSKHAERVDLCLFERPGGAEASMVVPLDQRTRFVWHTFVPGLKAGQLYGYRVHGPWRPEEGYRFNPHRLLLDPYARAITGRFDLRHPHTAHDPQSALEDLALLAVDNAAGAPKCVVMDDAFDWEGDRPPDHPLRNSVIYEVHLKGYTAHPSSGASRPGTYLGFVERIDHLKRLGVTAVEFLPLHHAQDEEPLLRRGLSNYWGYNTIGYFAPDSRFASGTEPGCQVREFKTMVRELHKAGIEVILDVVYNHTAEGNHQGPAYCFKGIDNPTYYVLAPEKRYYRDYTGCGNSLNFGEPTVIKMVMDSLRTWVEEMHVDGFRFDLATVLGREEGRFDRLATFFTAVHQDPVLSRVKLIAEPWDCGWDSYQVGNFPVDWAEWNGKYRDTVRRFAKGDGGMVGELATRLTGSADLYLEDGRTPYHSVNFVTCHDGFTLHDLTAYDRKHNEANGENNRDGNDTNWSWNNGHEGPAADPAVLELRARQAKNFLSLLFLSQGVPMLLGGDEFLRTQQGNNNAYCQDNPLSWFDWTLALRNAAMVEFVSGLVALRRRHPHFRRRAFFTGTDGDGDCYKDIHWLSEAGGEPDWRDPERRRLAFMIEGDEKGTGGEGDFLILVSAHWEPAEFLLPTDPARGPWRRILDTALPAGRELADEDAAPPLDPPDRYTVRDRSVVALWRATRQG
jgi:glycogen operon protein